MEKSNMLLDEIDAAIKEKKIKDMDFVLLNNEHLVRSCYYNMNKIDKDVACLQSVYVRNTLDHYKNVPLLTTKHNENEDLTKWLIEFFSKNKTCLGLDITKNVMVSINYTRQLQPSYNILLIV